MPKWVWGTLNDEFIRRSAKTRSWEHAEEFRRSLEQQAQAASSASYAIIPAQHL